MIMQRLGQVSHNQLLDGISHMVMMFPLLLFLCVLACMAGALDQQWPGTMHSSAQQVRHYLLIWVLAGHANTYQNQMHCFCGPAMCCTLHAHHQVPRADPVPT